MASDTAKPLAISMGEPAGIGTEVLLKSYAWMRQRPAGEDFPFYVIDDPARLAALARIYGTSFRITTIERPDDTNDAFADGLPVLPLAGVDPSPLIKVEAGKPSPDTAEAVTASIRQAVYHALSGEAAGVVTLPIQKAVLQKAGFPHPGHTEYLGALTEDTPMPEGMPRGPVMMLASGSFRAIPVTIHIALKDVPKRLAADQIVRTGMVAATSLRRDFGIDNPRIAIAGLNPHAGEDGRMGEEERSVIIPAIEALREQKIEAAGPFPADTMFHEDARRQYDVALAMYHDQALIPIKTFDFHGAVNITLGLPIIRTSPDHGTGLTIAGQGVARPESTIAAILTAAQMAESRARFDA